MDLKNRIPCAIMNQGKSMLIDKTSILSQNLGHYLFFWICFVLLVLFFFYSFLDFQARNSLRQRLFFPWILYRPWNLRGRAFKIHHGMPAATHPRPENAERPHPYR